MVKNTLRDLDDSEAQLKVLEVQLSEGTEAASEFGGSRHATAVLSCRTLLVVRRKLSLLHDVEERTAEFEAVQARAGELEPQIAAGSLGPPPELAGIRRFISSYTHSPGNPGDANKSDFRAFASSFKLPAGHSRLRRLRSSADEAGEWWADACLRRAEDGADHRVLRRLFDVAEGTGVDVNHFKLVRATKILIDRLADRVLKDAQDRQQQDAALAKQRGDRMEVGPASFAADKIDKDIAKAIEDGVPQADARLKQSAQVAKALREADGMRKRMAGRQKRLDAASEGK